MKFSLILLCVSLIEAKDSSDIYLDVPDLIKKYGYPVESHHVVTADGYILTLHRIPHGRNTQPQEDNHIRTRRPVFLQHGLLASSACWLMGPPEKAPAYVMADAGYDVWMGNARGNHYSRNHTRLNPEKSQFWDFSFDEMAYYDLPAAIDYVLNTTSHPSLSYVGHSMGTTIFFALMSSRPEYQKKVRVMFALAPVARVAHIRSPIRRLAPRVREFQLLAEALNEYEILPHSKRLIEYTEKLCATQKSKELMCLNLLFLLTGFDFPQFNITWLPTILSHSPEGASLRTIVHYAQEVNSGQFSHYDFGIIGNILTYHQSTPPVYSLTNITVPIVIFWGKNDYLADPEDVEWLASQLPNVAINVKVPYPYFNHVDFLWGKDSLRYIFKPILKYLPFF